MPAVSKAQQRFMGMVHAVKKGDMSAPSPEVAQAAASMKKKDAKDFASTKHKGLPEKKETKESFAIDPKEHRKNQRVAKIRNLARKGATEGERKAAERKTKGPKMFGEAADTWHPDPEQDRKLSSRGAKLRAREDRESRSSSSSSKPDSKKLRSGESYMDYAKRQRAEKARKYSSTPKPKERKRDKIGRKLGNLVDRIGGIKKEEVVHEGVGLEIARAIDKTRPPLGRPSLRRKISGSLKMREVDKASKKKRTFKHADSSGKKSFKDFKADIEKAKNK